MSESCEFDNNCAACGQDCADRQAPLDFKKPLNEASSVEHVIAVVSGKGGVGKSLVTSLMAVISQRRGNRTAIMDADVTGPSIPKTFKVTEKATANDVMIFPVNTKTGIQLMSVNLLLEDETDPVVWRGPVIAGTVEQFWTDVLWDGVDYMFVDMPPGTGDVPLTVFQSLPVDGIIVVASPQELVGMIVEKAVKMAELMDVPVLGIVENMSYFECPDCHTKHQIFGESHVDEIADKFGIKNVARIPIDPKLAAAVDAGMIELFEGDWLDEFADNIEKELQEAEKAEQDK
ncbi:MAG: Mrp/NBP35 family ATP-binding protein [Anaerovoracaceae bacterium]|nr:Mrp/NBP35 family ATP-binding protein [Bacillota bacterium]MDY2670342.1 Mrp/NBP35 family ATP-binding protein [Anaerovoracaceae bacterium]